MVTMFNATSEMSPTVGVIGCGPAGMFFLRQLEKERDRLLNLRLIMEDSVEISTIDKKLTSLPRVTVFEKESRCGGLWQSKLQEDLPRRSITNETHDLFSLEAEGMYDGMWINAPKEFFEFEDYTFDAHFQKPMPAYLTRRQVFSYLEGATQNVIEKYTVHSHEHKHGSVMFGTEVSEVEFDDESKKFSISTIPSGLLTVGEELEHSSNATGVYEFDKVVFASGINHVPIVPTREINILNHGNITFEMPIVHSSQVKSLGADIRGKNFLFIGGAYSAEDLALSFIKRGANHIFVTSRTENSHPIIDTNSWPMDKLTFLVRTDIKEVVGKNRLRMGRGESRTPAIEKILDQEFKEAKVDFVLEDIDAVVFCTGYGIDVSILASNLLQYAEDDDDDEEEYGDDEEGYDDDDEYDDDDDDDEYNTELRLDLSENDWPNIYDPSLFDPKNGKILPSETDSMSCGFPVHANNGALRADPTNNYETQLMGTYNTRLISNPGMFYHYESSEVPLLSLDIYSAFILKVILGEVVTPETKEEVWRERSRDFSEAIRYSAEIRYYFDEVFAEAYFLKTFEKDFRREFCPYTIGYNFFKMFLHAKLAGHPAGKMLVEVQDQGDIDGQSIIYKDEVSSDGRNWTFSEKGHALMKMQADFLWTKSLIKKGTNQTFRDLPIDSLQSIHTGTKPRNFSSLWLHIDDLNGDEMDYLMPNKSGVAKNLSFGHQSEKENKVIENLTSNDSFEL